VQVTVTLSPRGGRAVVRSEGRGGREGHGTGKAFGCERQAEAKWRAFSRNSRGCQNRLFNLL